MLFYSVFKRLIGKTGMHVCIYVGEIPQTYEVCAVSCVVPEMCACVCVRA
jgi:hypothetical protein